MNTPSACVEYSENVSLCRRSLESCTGPQMIPIWTANDPEKKSQEWDGGWNGLDRELM